MRILGPSAAPQAAATRKPAPARGGFSIDETAQSGPAARPSSTSPLDGLDALIAIQSGATPAQERRRKRLAAAQRTLDLLERLRASVLEGAPADLDALASGAQIGAGDETADCDGALDALVNEIALRARVELAKRGR